MSAPTPRSRRRLLGWTLMGLGAAILLWSVLQLSSAGHGTRPTPGFAQRRGYDQVKREVHEIFPFVLARGLAGLALLLIGHRLSSDPASRG